MKYSVMDKNGDFIGVVEADSESEALKKAEDTIPDAATVEEKPEHPTGRSGAQ